MNDTEEGLILGQEARRFARVNALFEGRAPEAFASIAQGSCYSGSKHLRVRVDEATVCFADDGNGISDPRRLFEFGDLESGAELIAAATGIGVLALLALSREIVVTSWPKDARPWRMKILPNAFDGAPVWISYDVPARDGSGTEIQAILASKFLVPERGQVDWRHAFPMRVSIAYGAENSVDLRPEDVRSHIRLDTAVGEVFLRPNWQIRNERRNLAVWGGRLLSLPRSFMSRLKGRLRPNTIARMIVESVLDDMDITWVVDSQASGVRPEIVLHPRIFDGLHLDVAITAIADALIAQIDEVGILERLTDHVREDDVVSLEERITSVSIEGRIGALGGVLYTLPVPQLLPLLGYVQSVAAPPLSEIAASVYDDAEEGDLSWSGVAARRVLVRPKYRAESWLAAAAANAAGVATVCGEDSDPSLPLVRLSAEGVCLSPTSQQIFVREMYLVDEQGAVLHRLHGSLASSMMEQDDILEGFTPEFRCRVAQEAGVFARYSAIHVLPEGDDPLGFIQSDPSFGMFAAYEVDRRRALGLWIHDYTDLGNTDDPVDSARLADDFAMRIAGDFGPDVALRTARRIEAERLHGRCLSVASFARSMLLEDPVVSHLGEMHGLNPDLLRAIESAVNHLGTVLSAVTVPALLREAEGN